MSQLRQPDSIPTSASGASPLAVALDAALRAGDVIRDRFDTRKEINFKGPSNPVTDVDLLAEKSAVGFLREEYPDFGVLSEESEPIVTGSPYRWIIDPLDGTRNYVFGIPHVAVVVALARHGEVVVGVTYDPIRGEIFTAEKGNGAHLNATPISVSAKDNMDESLLGMDMGSTDEHALAALEVVRTLWKGTQGVRLMGSSALGLAYAACGRVDLYFHRRLSPWDLASGLLLVSEAGGRVVDRLGEPATLESNSVVASSPQLVDAFLGATVGLEWRR